MKKTILVLLLLLAGIGVGVAAGIVWGQGERHDLRKQAEADRATAAGLSAAVEVKQRRLETMAADIVNLTEQIDNLTAVAPSVEVREVTKWRTETVKIPVDKLIPGINTVEYVEGQCVVRELPPVEMFAVGSEARLETRAGNLFAVGTVDLYSPPDTLLATAPWKSELTEIMRQRQRPAPWRLSLLAGVSTDADALLGVSWQSRRRWGVSAGVLSKQEDACRDYGVCFTDRTTAVWVGATVQIWPWRRR